jgi:hypothetical protein
MVRKFKKADKEVLEDIVQDSLERIGIKTLEEAKRALLIRLIAAGIANYFFNSPDDLIDLGFLRFKKNPEKNELFAVEILKDEQAGVINADTLYRYYTGNLTSEKALKETMKGFVTELLNYSQAQSNNIAELTGKLKKRRN